MKKLLALLLVLAGHTWAAAPAVPTNLTYTGLAATKAYLSWDNVGAATSYGIYRNGVAIDVSPVNVYTATNLSAGVQYTFGVSSRDDAVPNESAVSAYVTTTTATNNSSSFVQSVIPYGVFAVSSTATGGNVSISTGTLTTAGNVSLTAGSATIGNVGVTSTVATNHTQVNGVAVSTGNGASGTGVQRVAVASDNAYLGASITSGVAGLTVTASQGGPFTVSGSVGVTGSLPAGTNYIGAVGISNSASLNVQPAGAYFGVTCVSGCSSSTAYQGVSVMSGVAGISVTAAQQGTWNVNTTPSGAAQAVSVLTSVLPTGAATSALQTTGNNSLSSIDSKLTNSGSGLQVNVATLAGSPLDFKNGVANNGTLRVALASDNTYLPVSLVAGAGGISVTAAQQGTWNVNTTPSGAAQAVSVISGVAGISTTAAQQGTWNVGLSTGTNYVGAVGISNSANLNVQPAGAYFGVTCVSGCSSSSAYQGVSIQAVALAIPVTVTSGVAGISVTATLAAGNATVGNLGTAGNVSLNAGTKLVGKFVQTTAGLDPLGIFAGITGYGAQRSSPEPSPLFNDTFDGGAIDTTVRWNTSGTTASQSNGVLSITNGTVASAFGALQSQMTFAPIGLTFEGFGLALKLESGTIQTNTHRFWGMGTANANTTVAPLTDAIGFEVGTDGNLYGVVYAATVRSATSALSIPTDGAYHKYIVVFRTDTVIFYLDSTDQPVGTLSYTVPAVQALPIRIHCINGATPPGSAPTFQSLAIGLADTGRSSSGISDGTYPSRKAVVSIAGALSVLNAGGNLSLTAGTATIGNVGITSTVQVGGVAGISTTATLAAGGAAVGVSVLTGVAGISVTAAQQGTWNVGLNAGTNYIGAVGISNSAALTVNGGTGAYFGVSVVATITQPVSVQAGTATIGNVGITSTVSVLQAAITKGTQGTNGVTTQDLKDAGRVNLVFYAVAAAAGATATETAITLNKAADTGATSSAVSFVITSGKRFRISSITVATRGNAAATAQTTTFNLRVNTAGAVVTTSTPIVFSARSATPATASAWDRFQLPIPDGLEFLGNGTIQFGMTANATYVTNAPTWDVVLTGFEY